jgi:hypothetical protein
LAAGDRRFHQQFGAEAEDADEPKMEDILGTHLNMALVEAMRQRRTTTRSRRRISRLLPARSPTT